MSKTYIHQILIADVNRINEHLPNATKSIPKHFDPKKYEYNLWTNDDIRTLLEDNFSPEVLWAYDKLKPYAYKADLARYAILYLMGGWYIDINLEIVGLPPKEDEYDLILFRDYNNGTRMAPWQLANGLIYAKPDHPVFNIALNKIIEHVGEKYYGKRTLSVTGPELFGWAVAHYGWDNGKNDYLVGDFVDNDKLNRKMFITNKGILALHKVLNGGVVGVKGTNDYVKMWHNKDIYN